MLRPALIAYPAEPFKVGSLLSFACFQLISSACACRSVCNTSRLLAIPVSMHCCNVNFPEVLFCEKILTPNAQRIAVVKKTLFITFTIDKKYFDKISLLSSHQAG